MSWAGSGECSCGGKVVKGMSVKPTKGDAVLFWSMGLDGQSDPNSIHAGCEVLAGEKWSATKWMSWSIKLKEILLKKKLELEEVCRQSPPGLSSSIQYKLTKRQAQEEIQRCTGAVVITRGKYHPPNASTDGEKPLYLHISAGANIGMLKSSCKLAIKQLKSWMKPEKAKTSITTFPSSAEIVSEPLGVVLIISAWNYPFLLSLDPVVGAIAASNAVVLKPSELAPATSSLLAKLLGEYMDSSSVRVVEGAVAETSALLEQKWDKICYTDFLY